MNFPRTTRRQMVLRAALLVISLAALTASAQTYSVLYNFGQNTNDPITLSYSGILAQGRDGNLYGTVAFGGTFGAGAMIKVTPAGKLTVVYNFDGSVGFAPFGGLTLGADGNFYGTNGSGGRFFQGTVFKITPRGIPTLLYEFTGKDDGASPYAPPIQGRDGSFYGTTEIGGPGHAGTIYKITRSGKLTTLHSFDNTHGAQPIGPLLLGSDGNFYGTTVSGGPANAGTVFKMTPAGKFTVLHYFDGTDGFDPSSLLVEGRNGNFYGTAFSGGAHATGSVFKITPKGKLTVLHHFNGSTDGGNPYAGLVLASDGNFYGVNSFNGNSSNQGTIFKVTPQGQFSVLYTFDGVHGSTPEVTLLQHTNGNLFGDTTFGGTFNNGTFFQLKSKLPGFVSLETTSGRVGKHIGILGQGFTGTKDVSFNGTTAAFRIISNSYLTATVPFGATSGPVVVLTPHGPLRSSKDFVVVSNWAH